MMNAFADAGVSFLDADAHLCLYLLLSDRYLPFFVGFCTVERSNIGRGNIRQKSYFFKQATVSFPVYVGQI